MSNPRSCHATPQQRWDWFSQHLDPKTMRMLFLAAYRLLPDADDAEDALQEALLLGAAYAWRLKDESKFLPWMYEIVRREALRRASGHDDGNASAPGQAVCFPESALGLAYA